MRYLLALLLVAGCAADRSEEWNWCVGPWTMAGERLNHAGKAGTVTRIYGPSSRCQNPAHPNLADVAWDA